MKFEKLRISPDVFHFGHNRKKADKEETSSRGSDRDCLSDSETVRSDVFDRLMNGSVGQVRRKKRKPEM